MAVSEQKMHLDLPLVLATHNEGKVAEFKVLLGDFSGSTKELKRF